MVQLLTIIAVLSSLTASGPTMQPLDASRGTAGWAWPVSGPVLRDFDPPDDPYGSGHRGIDIATLQQTLVMAPAAGRVTFAGPVGGKLFLTIDHGQGLQSTYSWLDSLLVRKGQDVEPGVPVALTGWGHSGALVPHLHFAVKLDGAYVDPLAYLGPLSVSGFIQLAPLE